MFQRKWYSVPVQITPPEGPAEQPKLWRIWAESLHNFHWHIQYRCSRLAEGSQVAIDFGKLAVT